VRRTARTSTSPSASSGLRHHLDSAIIAQGAGVRRVERLEEHAGAVFQGRPARETKQATDVVDHRS